VRGGNCRRCGSPIADHEASSGSEWDSCGNYHPRAVHAPSLDPNLPDRDEPLRSEELSPEEYAALDGEEEDMIFGWVATCVRADFPPSVFGPFVHEHQAVEEVRELNASGCEGKHEVSAIEVPFTGGATTSLTVTRRSSPGRDER
jgi:hypothetical protein